MRKFGNGRGESPQKTIYARLLAMAAHALAEVGRTLLSNLIQLN